MDSSVKTFTFTVLLFKNGDYKRTLSKWAGHWILLSFIYKEREYKSVTCRITHAKAYYDKLIPRGEGVLKFELGTDVQPEVSTTNLFDSEVITSYSSTWITLLLLCTSAALVLCCDQFDQWFDRCSRQVKRDPVDLVDITLRYWITKPEKTEICNICLNHLFLEGPFFFCKPERLKATYLGRTSPIHLST